MSNFLMLSSGSAAWCPSLHVCGALLRHVQQCILTRRRCSGSVAVLPPPHLQGGQHTLCKLTTEYLGNHKMLPCLHQQP